MKFLYSLFFILLAWCFETQAQDIIIKCSGEEIKALVKEVNTLDIKYQKPYGKDKKLLSIPKKDVHKIKYFDNSIDFFNNLNVSDSKKKSKFKKAKFDEYTILEKAKVEEVVTANEDNQEENTEYSNKLFVIYGLNYAREVALSTSNRVGVQLGLGYRFSKNLGAGILIEPNFYIPNADNSSILQANYMIYPALFAKITPKLHLYGGIGPNTILTSTLDQSVTKSLLSYQTGMTFDIGKVGLKLGYFNIFQYGVRGVITVGICNNLNW